MIDRLLPRIVNIKAILARDGQSLRDASASAEQTARDITKLAHTLPSGTLPPETERRIKTLSPLDN